MQPPDGKLDPITPTGDFSLAQPAIAKISGTISDPYQNLTPVLGIGGMGTSGISHYQCTSLDTGTFPNPIFFYPEGFTGIRLLALATLNGKDLA